MGLSTASAFGRTQDKKCLLMSLTHTKQVQYATLGALILVYLKFGSLAKSGCLVDQARSSGVHTAASSTQTPEVSSSSDHSVRSSTLSANCWYTHIDVQHYSGNRSKTDEVREQLGADECTTARLRFQRAAAHPPFQERRDQRDSTIRSSVNQPGSIELTRFLTLVTCAACTT